jgi:hypothetical protein
MTRLSDRHIKEYIDVHKRDGHIWCRVVLKKGWVLPRSKKEFIRSKLIDEAGQRKIKWILRKRGLKTLSYALLWLSFLVLLAGLLLRETPTIG